jgi:hypothetical protein
VTDVLQRTCGFWPAVVVFDRESYTCDSIILWSGFGRKVLSVALDLSLARTLGNLLSKDYTVKASVGHIRNLPPHEMGVDMNDDFRL